MTIMFWVFFVGGSIGFVAGVAWANAGRDLERGEHGRMTKELWQEITRQRAQIADMIGRE